MTSTFATRIRERLGDDASARTAALLAVLDECQQMRADCADLDTTLGAFYADNFERVIAEKLGIEH